MLSKINFLKIVVFLSISAIAIFARTYQLNNLPPALFSDEVDAGYQAYIFNQNKTDYFGNFLPTHFHSFSDWRTSLHIYSIAVFQNIFSPELSVRLPSVFFGLVSTILIYLITRSPIASFLFAISPWSIHFSRTGFEVSGMICAILAGIYFWQNKRYFTSLFFFLISTYFYSTSKMFVIIIGFLVLIIWKKDIIRLGLRKITLLFIFSCLIMTPMIIDTINQKSGFRFSYISIFSEPHKTEFVDQMRYEDIFTNHQNEIGVKTPTSSFYFHNKYQVVLDKFVKNYISSFSTDFLVLNGDSNLRHGFGNTGLIYFLDLFFVFLGIFYSLKSKNNRQLSTFFLYLLILAPIPFSLTRDSNSPHATRLILMLPSIIYFSSVGINSLIKKRPLLLFIIISAYILLFANFWHHYQYHYPQISARSWHTGIKETLVSTQKYPDQKIFYSSKYETFLPFFFFYRHYRPEDGTTPVSHLQDFQSEYFSGQVLDNHHYFGFIKWSDTTVFPKNSIIIVPRSELGAIPPGKFKTIETISKKYVEQEEFIILQQNEK